MSVKIYVLDLKAIHHISPLLVNLNNSRFIDCSVVVIHIHLFSSVDAVR